MKNLNEYITEAIKKRIDLDNSDDNQLKKFSNELSKYINNKYKLDEQLDTNYVLNSLKLLKRKVKGLVVATSDFYYDSLSEFDYKEKTLIIHIYKMVYFYNEKLKEWQVKKQK